MSRPEIVAEISGNHRGDLYVARRLVSLAAEAGADAIKLQTYTPSEMVGYLPHEDMRGRFTEGPWKGQDLPGLYSQAHTPRGWHESLFDYARDLGMYAWSSAFSPGDVDFLESIYCERYKVASFELVDHELLAAVAKTGKPVILSIGMANHLEIRGALQIMNENRVTDLTLLVCTSAYPAHTADMNLARISALQDMAQTGYPIKVGLSDHTLGSAAACAAVMLGVTMIEKHLTDRRENGGPDAAFSMEPEEFKEMVINVERTHDMLGDGAFLSSTAEAGSRRLRRSLWWALSLPAGHVVVRSDVRSARPADGLQPSHLPELLGARLHQSVQAGNPVGWDDVGVATTLAV